MSGPSFCFPPGFIEPIIYRGAQVPVRHPFGQDPRHTEGVQLMKYIKKVSRCFEK
jgi:hypothetical protein